MTWPLLLMSSSKPTRQGKPRAMALQAPSVFYTLSLVLKARTAYKGRSCGWCLRTPAFTPIGVHFSFLSTQYLLVLLKFQALLHTTPLPRGCMWCRSSDPSVSPQTMTMPSTALRSTHDLEIFYPEVLALSSQPPTPSCQPRTLKWHP